jgi:hexosaminidase
LPLIPSPKNYETGNDSCQVNNQFRIFFDLSSEPEARYLAQKLRDIAGLHLEISRNSGIGKPGIYLLTNGIKGETHEAYNLEIKTGHIQISGEKEGIFYGVQSLLNLIPFETYREPSGEIKLPVMVIEDAPRFSYRGLHIDVCRNFQTKEQLLKILDLMAYYKLNTLLLYLTEDEGWRLEIEELPELTATGSKRGHSTDELDMLHPSYGSGPFAEAESNHGTGFYSRKDFKDILHYASERHIDVIPAINLPGHARAAIKAMEARHYFYSQKGMKEEAEEFRLTDPDDKSVYRSAQYYNDNVVCVARESVYHFFETVIDDVLEMYAEAEIPVGMIYTGGDEVPEGAWAGSPLCLELLNKLPGIKDPKNLQQYFLSRINKILLDRNLKTGGWEEIVLKKGDDYIYHVNTDFTEKKVVPYVWNCLNGSQDLAYRIANAGYPLVLCPVINFYFDLAYSNDPEEPGSYWSGFVNERNPWAIAPYNIFFTLTKDEMGCDINPEGYKDMVRLRHNAKENILGLQAQLWHETIRGGDMMEYYLLPKLISFAERCWAEAPVWESVNNINEFKNLMEKSWETFEYTLYEKELPKLSYLNGGYQYRIPPAGAIKKNHKLLILSPNPALEVRYTLGGDTPDVKSPVYDKPIEFNNELKIKVFDKCGKSSKETIIEPW